MLHGDTQYYVEDITRDALAALNITKLAEVNALLDNIVIQEALMSMQKAYAATNTGVDEVRCVRGFPRCCAIS